MAIGRNESLHAAKRAKNDEFYTQLSDIEEELRHYRKHFRGKTVLCNCDDAYESNFVKYFLLNFQRLGLKKLISTSYAKGASRDTLGLLGMTPSTNGFTDAATNADITTEITERERERERQVQVPCRMTRMMAVMA